MATSPEYDNIHKLVAEAVARGGVRRPAAGDIDRLMPKAGAPTGQAVAPQAPEREQGWSLGQGLIDLVSTGSYMTAGIGQKWGENIQAIERGEIGGALDLFNPIATTLAAGGGIQNRRAWEENLTDWGVDQKTATAAGLALDIVLDPLWLIPGGAIATGIKATAKGIGTASAATKAGVRLTPEAYKSAKEVVSGLEKGQFGPARTSRPYVSQSVTTGKEGITISEPLQQFYPTGQQAKFIENLIQGVSQRNIDEYARWSADRAARKATKIGTRTAKRAEKEALAAEDRVKLFKGEAIIPAIIKGTKHIADEGGSSAEKAASEIADSVKIADEVTAPEVKNDISAPTEIVAEAADLPSINQMARDSVQPARSQYLKARGIEEPEFDYVKISASEKAPAIAKAYDDLVSRPDDPDVINAYQKLAEEAQDQYDYMTNELGIKVEFVDYDPYHVGKNVNSKEMMRDIVENKTLLVKKSVLDADPATGRIHPLLTNEQNDIFRAVHDFFGHAATGRGFRQAGEEAAWVSHSVMFSPEARKAMTSETRGQNSWVNVYGKTPDDFAPQKVGFLPEEFIALPTEAAALSDRLDGANSFIGRTLAALNAFGDEMNNVLGLVNSPVAGVKAYSSAEITAIKKAFDEFTDAQTFAATTPEAKETLRLIEALEELISRPTSSKYSSLTGEDGSITGILELAQKALDVSGAEIQAKDKRALAMLQQLLDEPIDATDLLESALAVEGRSMREPAPFKATEWMQPRSGYGRPGFSENTLRQFFDGDPLLQNPEELRIAMGSIKAKPGSKQAKYLTERQALLWDNFRARNADILDDVKKQEESLWLDRNSVPDSELFLQMPDKSLIGQGSLPASIPHGLLHINNGHPATTLGAVLGSLGKIMARNKASNMGGLPTSQIFNTITEVMPEGTPVKVVSKAEDGTPDIYTYEKGAPLTEIEGGGRFAKMLNGKTELTNQKLIDDIKSGTKGTPERNALRAKLRKRGRDIEIGAYPVEIQAWLIDNLSALAARVKKQGVVDRRLLSSETTEGIAARLFKEIPGIKSMSDARVIAELGIDGVQLLRKKPARKYFIKMPADRAIDDIAQIGRVPFVRGTNSPAGNILRDPETGVPLDARGLPAAERKAATRSFEKEAGLENSKSFENVFAPRDDFKIVTEGGKNFTGREGKKYATQVPGGSKPLESLQVARSTIGAIGDAITAGEIRASKEQAQLLSNVLESLGIKVAENMAPTKVFNLFQQKAAKRFEEVIQMIESAAKDDSVAYHLQTVFKNATRENISIMDAIAKLNLDDLEARAVQWTDEALTLVDETCSAAIGRPNVFTQIVRGLN